ncbi:MAG: 3-dehydroquinate synthase [Acidobacteriota bacterium]|nr:3-dehydroquinate synthase [Acidobacteriota bacterium]
MTENNSTIIKIEFERVSDDYEIRVGAGLLESIGDFAKNLLSEKPRKICLFSNPKVYKLYGNRTEQSLKLAGFEVLTFLMKDGERYKNWKSLEEALEFFSEQKLTRVDAVVALGGGVVGDLAGFAAAIYLRGIPFIQVPTTLLAQIDSSVGGKTGINSPKVKNSIGAFYQPRCVLVDVETLKSLAPRELAAGFYEVVKHAALSGKPLLAQTQNFLTRFPLKQYEKLFAEKNADFLSQLQDLISANIAFKAEIVAGDERETVNRNDNRSRKILNFGHTIGHALEQLTQYKLLKHGEAVAYGMFAAADLSKRLGKLNGDDLRLLNEVLLSVGRLPELKSVASEQVIAALTHDKKAVGNSFKWILLEEIGRTAIVDNKEISPEIVRDSLEMILRA